jgi:1-acyl-sn-glycerol-3-phosphate acyltransferase
MQFVGSALIWLWVVGVGTIAAAIQLVLWLLLVPLGDQRRRAIDLLNHIWAVWVLAALPHIRMRFLGAERLQGNEPFLVCANHASVSDVIALLCLFKHGKFISKSSVFWAFPLGLSARLSGYISASPNDDGSSDRVLMQGERWLRRGCHVLAFPEGTRSPNGRVLRFRKGPFVLAQKANVRILPIALRGTGKIIPKGSFLFSSGTAEVMVLEPLEPRGDVRELAQLARIAIQAALEASEAVEAA